MLFLSFSSRITKNTKSRPPLVMRVGQMAAVRGGLSLPWEPVWGPHTHATTEHVAQLGAQSLHVMIIAVGSTHVTVE